MIKLLKKYFVTGLIVVGPVALTIYVLVILFQFADSIFGKYLNDQLQKILGVEFPFLGFIVPILIIFAIGFLANQFLGRKIFPFLERWFAGIPLIKNIYPAFKQIIRFILAQKEFGFKKVVLVEYPSSGIWSIGFLTNENFKRINQVCQQDLVVVFIPNSPGPLTGYTVFVPKEKVRQLDIPVSEAIKIIISAGVFKSQE